MAESDAALALAVQGEVFAAQLAEAERAPTFANIMAGLEGLYAPSTSPTRAPRPPPRPRNLGPATQGANGAPSGPRALAAGAAGATGPRRAPAPSPAAAEPSWGALFSSMQEDVKRKFNEVAVKFQVN